jgi:hypothetical protein
MLAVMSARNGDRARFNKDRRRKLRHRRRIRAFSRALRKPTGDESSPRAAVSTGVTMADPGDRRLKS